MKRTCHGDEHEKQHGQSVLFFYFLRSFMNFTSFFVKYVPYPMTTIMVTSVFRKSRMPMAITPIYDHCTIQGQ